MLYVLIVLLLADYIFGRFLSWLNLRHWKNEPPEVFRGMCDEEKYKRSQEYEKAKTNFGLYTSTFGTVITLALLLTGGFGWLHDQALEITPHPVWSVLLFFGLLAAGADLLNLPFGLYRTFVIEERFGFNRTTARTFLLDKVKSYALGALLGGGLLYVFLVFYGSAGPAWWLYVWLVFALVMLGMTMFYASVIVPLFNKLTPLPEGALRTAIEQYCAGVEFKLSNLFVMDGSRRSSKANAFFSGIGSRKRIVLFDTLVKDHPTDELVAVLAHEIGHYKKKHTRVSLVLSLAQTGLMLFLLSVVIAHPSLSSALGGSRPSVALGLLAFGILYSPVSFLLGIVMNGLSRKNEFEADRYARDTFGGPPLAEALKRLSVNQLSNLAPHPWYVFFYYSHPPVTERLKALAQPS